MSKSTVQTTPKGIAYGEKFLDDTYTGEPYSGSADVERVLQLSPDYTPRIDFDYATRIDFDYDRKKFHIWPEKKDPITQLNLIESEEEEIQKLIYQIKASTILWRNEIANRLIMLFKDSKEEDPYGTGITADSLRNFIRFLELYPNLKYPSISLTPEHNIYVSWKYEHNRVFSIHFLPNKDTRFVIFVPNDRHLERTTRISGITTVDILIETVSPYKVTDWIFDER